MSIGNVACGVAIGERRLIWRVLCLFAAVLCVQGCISWSPQASTPIPLDQALKIVARDLNNAAPVVLSDIEKTDGQKTLKLAIKARQCAINQSDPPLAVITGPMSLQLQGTFTGQAQASFPEAFQLQATRAQQQQLTVPITFVPASALGNFFLGQNIPNVSGVPKATDLNDAKYPDQITLIKRLLAKSQAIESAAAAQIKEYAEKKKALQQPPPVNPDKKRPKADPRLNDYCQDALEQDLDVMTGISVLLAPGAEAKEEAKEQRQSQ